MLNTYKYTLLVLSRTPGAIIWLVLFPLIMSTIFMMMFNGLEAQNGIDKVRVAVVESGENLESAAFKGFTDAVSSDDGPLDITYTKTEDRAKQLVEQPQADPYVGYVTLSDKGAVHVSLAPISNLGFYGGAKASLLVLLMDSYTANAALIKDLIQKDPMSLAQNPKLFEKLFSQQSATQQVQLTHYKPKESVRYYFALLGMSAMFGASAGLLVMSCLRANFSALGARRNLGATSHASMVIASLFATWTVCFICLLIAFAYMKFVIGVDFGDRDGLCIGAIALSSLCATALGCAVSSIPKIPAQAKDGIVTAIVCVGALFAGLYGTFAMDMANIIAENFPVAEIINPVADVSQTFYSILYFDSLEPFFKQLAILVVFTAVLLAFSISSLRRTRYASL